MLASIPLLAQATSAPFKRSQHGLFHGKLIQFGNNVPFSKHKTRRTWLPNIQQKGLRSDLLGRELQLKVSTKALKTIKKYGSLDQYIFNTRSELLGPEGMRIRLLLRDRQEAEARKAAQEAERAKKRAAEAMSENEQARIAAASEARVERRKAKFAEWVKLKAQRRHEALLLSKTAKGVYRVRMLKLERQKKEARRQQHEATQAQTAAAAEKEIVAETAPKTVMKTQDRKKTNARPAKTKAAKAS